MEKELGRVCSLLEISIELMSEREPVQLSERFLRAARSIVGAQFATLALASREGSMSCMQHTITTEEISLLSLAAGQGSALTALAAAERSLRLSGAEAAALANKLPFARNTASLLAVPFATKSELHGLLWLTEKPGGFDSADEQIAQTLTSMLCALYDNLELYGLVQHHAAQLQLRLAQREEAE